MDIHLRELRLADAAAQFQWMNDPETVRYLGYGFIRPRRLEDIQTQLQMQLDGEFTGVSLAITDETDVYLGEVNLLLPDERARTAEVSIVLIKSARGRGAANAALKLLLDRAFTEWGYERLYLKCLSANAPAIRLYERAGFRHEGTLRKHLMTAEGLMDVQLYGVLREEYLALRGLSKKQ